MKIINDTVPSYNEQEPEQMSLDDVKNMYFTDYAGNYTQTDAIVAGVRSTGMQLEKVAKVGLPQAVGSYVSGLAEPVADVMTKVARPLAAVYPDGGKILDGSLKMEIADKIKERGKVLIETANRNLQVINEEYTKNNPHLAELQSKVGFDIGAQGSQYGAMLLSGAFSPLLSGAVMGGMVYTGEAEESIEKYKKEHGGSLEGYGKQASQDLFWDAANSYVQGVIETKFGAGAQVRAFKGVKDILKNFVKGYTQEFGEEASQDAVDFAFDKFRGRLAEDETLLSRFNDNLRGYVVAGLFGGSTGMAFATYNRYKGIETAEKMLDGVVPEEQKRVVAEAIYNNEVKTLEDVVTVSLATSSSLSAKRGDVYNSLVDTILKAVNNSRKQGGYASIRTDEEAIEYAKAEANEQADRVTKEAFLRNKDITQVFNANKVAYEKGKIVLPMTEGLRQVEKTKIDKAIKEKKPSVLQFIRSKGGVIDEGGELKSRDASKQVIGLVNKNGKSLDSIGEALWEEGYFLERPTVAQVLDYIDDELKGIKHYPVGYVEEQAKSRKQTEEMIDEYIRDYSDAMGYDLKNMSYNEKVEVYEQMNRNLNAQGIPTFDELSEEQQERVSILMENGLSEEEAIYMLGLPEYMQEAYTLAQENERLDDIYPAYEGETININGQEKTVYNSNGDRIAKSKEALENFYRWFGDSKVVDEQGRPLVVYHGTRQKGITEFKSPYADKLIFFAYKKEFADNWAKNAPLTEEQTQLYRDMPYFSIEVSKKYREKYGENWAENESLMQEARVEKENLEKEYLRNAGIEEITMPVYLKAENTFKPAEHWDLVIDEIEKYYGTDYRAENADVQTKEYLEEIKDGKWIFFEHENVIKKIRELGFDSIELEEISGQGITTIAVFEGNNQIKSTQNRGTYSESENIYYQSAFAGSRVDYDRPSLEAIGSGEGNQAHGWGLYYALNKDVAEGYRKRFSNEDIYFKGKKLINTDSGNPGSDYWTYMEVKNRGFDGAKDYYKEAIEIYENSLKEWPEQREYTEKELKQYRDGLEKIESLTDEEIKEITKQTGQVHEVDIPENPYLLDEQAGYEAQPELVKKVFDRISEEFGIKTKGTLQVGNEQKEINGKYVYNHLADKLGSPRQASTWLNEQGIKGITYDGRQDGRCFVIFNPADVKVIQKFYQRKNASISFFPDKALIDLTETADAHSLPHEFEHYWLENTFLYTKTSQASPEYKKTFQAVADYLGITEDQEKIEEWQHEKFARSYEEYLRTAKAPNPKVKAAFDDYTKWLRNVYRRLKSKPRYRGKDGKLVVPRLTPAIIDYFNSMFGYIPNQEMAEEMTVTPEIEKAAAKVEQDFEKVIKPEEKKTESKEEPQKKISRYAERTAGMQVEYEGITIADQLEKAQEFVKNNPQKAEEVVKGGQAPDGLTRNAVLLAYIDYMKSKGKAKEASDAIVELSLSGTKQGQEISMLRVANNNPTEFDYWINKVVDVRRKNNIAKHFRTEAKAEEYIKETAKAIYQEMKGKTGKERAKIAEKWQKIVAEKGLTLYQMDDETYNSIDKIENKLNKALDGEQITEEQADKLFDMTNDLRNSFEETQSENGNPSIETLKKLKEINDYSNSLNPTAQGIIFSSLYGRSVMLMSVKSPVLNIVTDIEVCASEKASRYAMNIANGLSNDNLVDKKKINDYREWSKQVYKETGIMSSVVDNLFDEAKVLGETRDSSQGAGKFRALSRFVEDIAFQKLMGAPDNYWKDITFVDVAGNKATQKAYEEGLKGEEARKRANELFDDAILYTPQTEEGQEIRKAAMIATHEATFTQDSSVAKFSLKIREALNMISGRHFRLGEMILPFVKTPANVQMLGIEASVGFLYTAYHIKDIVTNPKSAVSQRAIQAGFRNGVGIILAILVASSFDDDEDYIPEYDNASPKQRDIARLKNAPFNSVKIGGKYISLDYFGPLGVPLAGILKARKSDNKVWEYLKGVVGQGMKVPGVKEIQALTGDISRAIEYKKTSDQVAKDVMEWAGEQAYSRAVPSFVSDVAKFIDTYERETGGEFSNRIKAKIPVLREELPIKTDISGRRVEGEGIAGILFGARVKTANESKIVKEISRLNKSGNAPTLADPTRYGVFRDLIPELKNKIRSEFNLEYGKRVSELISSSQYQKMDDSDKKKQLNKIRKDITGKLKKTYGLDKRK